MKYVLEFSKTALADLDRHKKSGNKATLKKIETILNELMAHPLTGIGKPEELKYNYQGFYARRINKKHRIIYAVKEENVTIYILSAFGHYEDK